VSTTDKINREEIARVTVTLRAAELRRLAFAARAAAIESLGKSRQLEIEAAQLEKQLNGGERG
jgi:hypothetical protein